MRKVSTSTAVLTVAVIVAGCGGSSSTVEHSTATASSQPAKVVGHGSGELNCGTFPFDNAGDEDWRQDSYSFGPFGVSHNFAAGKREPDGYFHSKAPMLVEGRRSVVLSVPESERNRIGIEVLKPDRPISSLTLVPCADKARTMWAAGFVLRDRRPFRLDVQVGGRKGTVRVGSPESMR